MLPTSRPHPASPQLDLSHLSQEERDVIQSVIDRQKALESETFAIERYADIKLITTSNVLVSY